jgi:hypothetical protein
MRCWRHGNRRRKTVVTVQAKIRAADGSESVLPVVIPDLNDVRELAVDLHQRGLVWEGDAFGWHAEYVPQRAEPPVQSNLGFTPAEFCIGESGVWFFSVVWEQGPASAPVEFLDDSGLVRD